MTQAEVAKALGVSEASIRLYELGKRKPNPEVLERIAAAVGIDVQALREIEVESVRDALEVLFRLEDVCGVTPRPDGTLRIDRMAEHAPKMVTAIEKWAEMKRRLDEGEIGEADYEASIVVAPETVYSFLRRLFFLAEIRPFTFRFLSIYWHTDNISNIFEMKGGTSWRR